MADIIRVTPSIGLPASEIGISYIRSSGPGGQNVNKVATAAQLRFDLRGSPSLPGAVKTRAKKLAGARLSNDGVIVITASSYRTQPQNRDDAITRLVSLLRQAATPPKRRVKTRPTLGSKIRRLDSKTRRGAIKRTRSNKPTLD